MVSSQAGWSSPLVKCTKTPLVLPLISFSKFPAVTSLTSGFGAASGVDGVTRSGDFMSLFSAAKPFRNSTILSYLMGPL